MSGSVVKWFWGLKADRDAADAAADSAADAAAAFCGKGWM
jgi:hypothetical protein